MSTSPRRHTVIDSPVGPLTLVGDGPHLVGLYMDGQSHLPPVESFGERHDEDAVLRQVATQLGEYFAGKRETFDLPLSASGTAFQEQVWEALTHIPYGETWTYGRLAQEVGNPNSSRAVGLANGRNPMCIVVPCHRIVGADGSLTGFAGGVERKKALLDLERSNSALV